MMPGRHGKRLDAWIAAVDAEDLPDLHSFATGLKHDHEAVLAGLTLEHSSGAVEGKCQPDQDDQTPDVRPRRLRPAPQARTPGHLTREPETITKCGSDPLGVDTATDRPSSAPIASLG
jgi:hypothetical protein